MGDVARAGRTIVLVSHNIAAINSLSSRAILLRDGRIAFDGSVAEATALYYSESLEFSRNGANLLERSREGNGKARFSSIAIQPLDSNGERMEAACPGCDLSIDVEIECRTNFGDCNLALIFHDTNGFRVIDTNTAQKGMFVSLDAGQTARARFVLREVLLKPGKYFVGVFLGRHMLEIV